MAKIMTLECPSCTKQFDFLRHPSDEPMPRFCPLCGYDTQEEAFGRAITAPHVQNTAVVKGADYTYQSMVEHSEQNVHKAAAMAGCDASDMANLKITDMKDNLREGDIAAQVESTPVGQMVQQNPNVFGFQGAHNPLGAAAHDPMQLAAASHTGKDAFAGMKAVGSLRRGHAAIGAPVTDTPSLEVQRRVGFGR